MRDVVIVGGGHNALVTAAFLAKAGLTVTVLERSDRVGGGARTSELRPGFLCPTLAHTAAIDPAVVRALALEQHGLHIIRPAAAACAPTPDGRALVLWSDTARAAQAIAAFSPRDADRYAPFLASIAAVSRVLRAVNGTMAPSIDAPSASDVFELFKAGRAFRALGKADAYRLLRWMPMAVSDLVGEWFESEPLRATLAAGGVLGSMLGPRSAGSGALLLLLGAAEGHPVASGWLARGGMGAVAGALGGAARAAGVEVRTDAAVARIEVTDEAATGVVLSTGETIPARCVVSGVDPRRTLLGLVDPMQLSPDMVRSLQHIRMRGTLAKINYAVSALPRMGGVAEGEPSALSGRIRLSGTMDDIERAFDAAKYGALSAVPWMELTIPSITDPALAPAGQHVVSAYLQYAPSTLRGTTWDAERDRLGALATRTIERYAPGFGASVLAQEVITPLDLERTYGLTGGHIFHGELALDQYFVARPLLGWARYATPIPRLFLCSSGTHPGTGLTGRSGALAAQAIVRHMKKVTS